MNTKNVITALLVLALALATIFGSKKQLEVSSISETIQQLQTENQQLSHINDSLFQTTQAYDEKIQALVARNDQISRLNAQLSALASQRQRVKYVTSSAHLQTIRDSLDIVFNQALYSRLTADSLREQLQLSHLEASQRESQLWDALIECNDQIPMYPLTFQKSDDYITYDISITSDSTAVVHIVTRDTLNFAHTVQRNGFLGLGKRTYNVFAESTSPYTSTKTHSYIFKNRGILAPKSSSNDND